jgi:predicted glutamine amidotransferase
MCRFTLYLGPRICLGALLLDPEHSLIRQSSHSHEREEPLNGDGFGVGWYVPELSQDPAVFRAITPAWNNRNLHNLARVVESRCILAHVRAATHSSGVNEANCHPFRFGRYLLMHNGDIGSFARVRRRILESVGDAAFANVFGSTDSEHLFAVVIDELLARRRGEPLTRMGSALERAIGRVLAIVARHGGGEPSYLNVALADGENAVVSRYSSDAGHAPESLYYYRGGLYRAEETRRQAPAVVVSSERLTTDTAWREVPANHMILFRHGHAPKLRRLAC